MNSQIEIYASMHALTRAAADSIIDKIYDTLQEEERCTVALDCDDTLLAVYELLATPPFCDRVQWGKTHIFQFSEISAPKSERGRNFQSIKSKLLDNLPLVDDHFYRMGTKKSERTEYISTLAKHFPGEIKRFDLLVLGLSAQTALPIFLKQGFAAIDSTSALCEMSTPAAQYFLLLTAQFLKNAMDIIFVVSGQENAKIVSEIYTDSLNNKKSLLYQADGDITWLSDKNTAEMLRLQ